MKTLAQIFEEYSRLPEFLGMELRSVNQPGHFDNSMLQVAIFRSDLEEVECLLAAGADPNWRGQLWLHAVAQCGYVGSTGDRGAVVKSRC